MENVAYGGLELHAAHFIATGRRMRECWSLICLLSGSDGLEGVPQGYFLRGASNGVLRRSHPGSAARVINSVFRAIA